MAEKVNAFNKDKYKSDNVKAADLIARTTRLKMQQDYLDKTQAIAMKRMKCLDHHAAQDILASYKEMESQRFHECERLHHSVFSISHSLKKLRDDVRSEDKLRQLEIEHYRKSVLDLEKKIRIFSEANNKRFQKLLEEELALSSDLENLGNKCDDWNQIVVDPSLLKPPVKSVSKSYISNTVNTREEVLTFQRFLRDTGGHTGNWTEEDHLLFLRLRNKHKGKMTFLSLLKQHLPGISTDDILLHENWYQQYENLKAKQKQAIQEWKALKDKSSQQNGTNSESVELRQRSKLENCKESSAEKKQKIEAWKKLLQLKKELEEKKQWEDKQKKLECEQKRRERQALKKFEVERYRQEKLSEQQSKILTKQLNELHELEERAAQANVLRKTFREQVQLFIARKVSQREHQTLQEEARKKQLQTQKQKVNVGRDPERLLRHTATWHERCKQEDKKSTVNRTVPVLHLRNMPHLQVPSWRRDLV